MGGDNAERIRGVKPAGKLFGGVKRWQVGIGRFRAEFVRSGAGENDFRFLIAACCERQFPF